jgi:hypothetical protein
VPLLLAARDARLDAEAKAAAAAAPPETKVKSTGLAQPLGQLQASDRDLQPNFWASLRNSGPTLCISGYGCGGGGAAELLDLHGFLQVCRSVAPPLLRCLCIRVTAASSSEKDVKLAQKLGQLLHG